MVYWASLVKFTPASSSLPSLLCCLLGAWTPSCVSSNAQPREVSQQPAPGVVTLAQSLLPDTVRASGASSVSWSTVLASSPFERPSSLANELAPSHDTEARDRRASDDSSAGASHPTASLAELSHAIGQHDFELASQLLSHTPPEAAATPLYRLVSALVDLRLGRADQAVSHLEELESELPAHAELIEQWRAEAWAASNQYQDYLDLLYPSQRFSLHLRLSQRLLSDGQLVQSERFLNRAYGFARNFAQRGEVRLLRARLRLAQNRAPLARSDLRWLAISNPQHPAAQQAFELLSQEQRLGSLSIQDHYARASQLAEAGLAEQAELSLKLVEADNAKRYRAGDLAHLRGLALYRARRFADAVPALDEAVAGNAYKTDQARYLAARATSRSGDPKGAMDRFTALSRMSPKTPNTQYALFRIGREWSLLGEWEAAVAAYTEFLTRLPKHEFAEIAERERVIAWFAMGEYQRAAYWFRRLRARDPQGPLASLFRGLEALSIARLGHPETAILIWKEVAQGSPLSFSGMAARQRLRELGEAMPEPAEQAPVSPAMDFLLPLPVFELESLGLTDEAAMALSDREQAFAAAWAPRQAQAACQAHEQLSDGRRRYQVGYSAVRQLGFGDSPHTSEAWLWRCYFPTPYRQWVSPHTSTYGVSEALVYAVMRQESGFRARVQSPAGARGLMQIIEPTARKITDELERDYDPEHLDVPHHNIEYGAYYLSKLQSHFDHPALVAAAYNAGPDASTRWAAAGRTLPLELFVLRVPFDETRNYLQRVLVNLATYNSLYPEFERTEVPLEFLAPLSTGPAPRELIHRAPDDFY